MKQLATLLVVLALAGCANIMEKIPSRWDVNQAKVITDLQQQTRNFDCKADQATQVNSIAKNVEWFDIYSQTKPTRDIAKLTKTVNETVKEYQERLAKGPVSPLYCDLKKKIIQQQVDIIAGSVQGRF
jgi:PBP1b-binding outer membrane lipoprotein LpoB